MTAPAERAAPIPAEVEKLANDLLAIANASVRADGSDIPLGETCRKAALVLADRASQEERIREDERDRLLLVARSAVRPNMSYGESDALQHLVSFFEFHGAMLPVDRARLRGGAS